MSTTTETDITTYLQEYYGKVLQSSADLTEKTCCTTATQARFRETLARLPEEVTSRAYGCGCPIPKYSLEGLVCLDLGSGAGVDAFLLSKLVGAEGHVHGVDMTPEQLEVARRNAAKVAEQFGYDAPNTTFHEGLIETCEAIPSGSIDLVISDCVTNLSPRKDLVFETIYRVLKPGGEFFISDIVSDRRVPQHIAQDPRLVAECIGGALYEHDWFDVMRDAGFRDPRVVSREILQSDVSNTPIHFSSLTVRGHKLVDPPLDRRCEDYGQLATYTGAFCASPVRFTLDDHHVFEKGRPTPVCRNTARMLSETHLAKGFQVTDPVQHFGLFDCGPSAAPSAASSVASSGSCC